MTKLTPGSFLYNIVHGKNDNIIEKKPFYVQNKKDYLESLERNCKEGVFHLKNRMLKKYHHTKKLTILSRRILNTSTKL